APDDSYNAGADGAYLAVFRSPTSTELRYFEQVDHAPRADRYFHRTLTADELQRLDAFLKLHPIAQLGAVPKKAAADPAAPAPAETSATQPALAEESS